MRRTTWKLAVAASAVMFACDPALAACFPGDWEGVELCDEPDRLRVLITEDIDPAQRMYFGSSDILFLDVFNAGVIDTTDGVALELQGQRIAYTGSATADMAATEVGLSIFDPTLGASAVVDHDITAAKGIQVRALAMGAPAVRIDLKLNGTIEATIAGIEVTQIGGGTVDIDIGAGARIVMADPHPPVEPDPLADPAPPPIALNVLVDGPTNVTLAGKILGVHQQSVLGGADDTLTLIPGFELEGTINAGEQGPTGDTLVLGGVTGQTGTLDLGAIGRLADESDPIEEDDPVRGYFLGFENFAKSGGSIWTLKGTAIQNFDLDIEGTGTVNVTGSVLAASRFTVGEDATLAGNGTLGIIDVWGNLGPGDFSVGSMVAAEAILQPGSIFEVEVTNAGFDQLDVADVTIAGGSVRVIPSAGVVGSFHILTSDQPLDLSDRFEDVLISSPRYQADLSYDEVGKVTLNLARTGVTFSSYATTPQQAAVAALIDAMGEDAPYFDKLDVMGPEAAASFLEQLAGTDLAVTGGALIQSTAVLSSASLGRIQQQSGTLGPTNVVLGYSSFTADENWTDGLNPSAWGRLIAGTSTIGGATAGSVAMIGGADVQLGDDWTLGLLAGMGASSIVSGATTTSSTDLSAGFYGSREFGNFALRFGGSLTHHSVGSSRTVTAPGLTETFTANYGALTAQAFAEAAVEFDLGPVGLELFGDLGYARNFSAGFTETGGAGALTVASSSSDAFETVLGVRASHQTALGTTLLTTGAMLGWKHRFMAAPSTMNSLAGGTPFEVAGTSSAGHALVAGADLRVDIDERTALEAAYALEWGGSGAAHTVSARYTRLF